MHWKTKKIHVTHLTAVFALLQWYGLNPQYLPGLPVLALDFHNFTHLHIISSPPVIHFCPGQ